MPGKKRTRKDAGLEKYEEEYRSLADEQLRRALMDVGENPGPIDSSNRDIYIRLLVRKKVKADTDGPPTVSLAPVSPSSVSLVSSPPSSSGFTPTPFSISVGDGASQSGSSLANSRSRKSKVNSTSLTRPSIGSSTRPLSSSPQVSKLSASPTLTAKPKASRVYEINGLVAAVFTPFNSDGELNLSLIKPYADFLLHQRVTQIFVNGSTGESLSLTVVERKLLAEEWIKVSNGRLNVVVHVGTESLKSTCELATHANEIGASAIGVMPTTFFKPASVEALVMYLQKVGEAAPSTPMYYYHIPLMTGVNLSMEELVERASSDLPTLRGLKFTHSNLMELSRLVDFAGGKYNLMYGQDEQLLGALSMGVPAAVGSTYNYCGQLNNRLIQAFKKGDMDSALKEQRRSQAAIKVLHKYGGVAAGKSIMKLRGLDVGPPRLPLLPLAIDDYLSLKKELQQIGFSDWA